MSDSATLWTVAHQAPLSMEFYRQEYWSGLPCLHPGDLPDPRDWTCISCGSCIAVRFFIKETPGKSHFSCMITFFLSCFKHLSLSRDSILSYRSFVFCPWHLDLQSTACNSFGDRMCDGAISIFFSFFSLIMHFSHLLVPTCSLFFHSAYCVHTFLPNFVCLSDHQLFRLYPSITI